MNGKLIVLEGIDGSGKATQSGLLEDHLIKSGKDVMHISDNTQHYHCLLYTSDAANEL